MLIDGGGALSNDGASRAVLTKEELIQEVSRVGEIPLREDRGIVEYILASMVRAIQRGDKVEIRGFGSFSQPTTPGAQRPQPLDWRASRSGGQTNPVFQT